MTDIISRSVSVDAGAGTRAWLNAFLATGQCDDRPVLYRTLSVEFYPNGLHFIACDGTMLFRTWVPSSNAIDAQWPGQQVPSDVRVVVMDAEQFALGFMRTLNSAVGEFPSELTISVDQEESEQASLADELRPNVVTLGALGQVLHCRVLDMPYPDWRALRFGLDPTEIVDGMRVAKRLFATVGKMKAVDSLDMTFHGEGRRIEFVSTGASEVRGMLMPMRRSGKQTEDEDEK